MKRVLVDVDGVVANLMGGFEHFIRTYCWSELRPREITTFHIAKSPAHQELHRAVDLDSSLAYFLSMPDCYDHVPVIDGAIEGIEHLLSAGNEVAFITATLKDAPESYAPKFRWLAQHFPGVPTISCPSEQKHWFRADYGIDDRYDTCARWSQASVFSLLFRQPWNEAPAGTKAYDWKEIVDEICPR